MTLAPKDLERGSKSGSEEEDPKPQEPSSAENSDDDKDENSDAEDIFVKITSTSAGDCTMQGQRLLAMRFLEGQLRFDVTMPVGTSGCEMDGSTDLNAGLLLPLWHCPFLGCKHCLQSRSPGSHEKAWWKHVWETKEHQDILIRH